MAQRLIKYITLEEFKKLLAAEKDKKYKLAYVLGFGSGLRISEIVGYKDKIMPLNQSQVNLQAHQVRIIGKGDKERITCTSPWLNETNIKMLPLDIKRRTLQDRITKLGKRVLDKEISFHTLRHGFGNYMANEKNLPLPLLQSNMGHSRIDTVGIYTKANPKQAIEKSWEAWE